MEIIVCSEFGSLSEIKEKSKAYKGEDVASFGVGEGEKRGRLGLGQVVDRTSCGTFSARLRSLGPAENKIGAGGTGFLTLGLGGEGMCPRFLGHGCLRSGPLGLKLVFACLLNGAKE